MNVPTGVRSKLAAFALVLAIALGGGAALGAAVGPIDVGGEDAPHPASPFGGGHDGHGHGGSR